MVCNCLKIVGIVLKILFIFIIQKEDSFKCLILAIVVKSNILSLPIIESLTKKSEPSKIFLKFLK